VAVPNHEEGHADNRLEAREVRLRRDEASVHFADNIDKGSPDHIFYEGLYNASRRRQPLQGPACHDDHFRKGALACRLWTWMS